MAAFGCFYIGELPVCATKDFCDIAVLSSSWQHACTPRAPFRVLRFTYYLLYRSFVYFRSPYIQVTEGHLS